VATVEAIASHLRPDRQPARLASAIGLFLYVAVGGSLALNWESNQRNALTPRDDSATQVVNKPAPGALLETYLLVGSDSRANTDIHAADAGGIIGAGAPDGQRSDTIMLLRHNRDTGQSVLLSLPRDLWVTIAGTNGKERINSAFTKSAGTLVQTIQNNFHIDVNHYIQIDFVGFKEVVDAIGGVTVCFAYPTRDGNTGLNITKSGCPKLNGLQSLQYTRSRHYEELRNGKWIEDGTQDLGRIKRQQEFMLSALNQAQGMLGENPLLMSALLDAAGHAVTLDRSLTLNELRDRFKDLGADKLQRFSLPITPATIDGKAVLNVDAAAAAPILAYFRGEADLPPPTTTTG
jgi:LCP family protein required for cell wall assembly